MQTEHLDILIVGAGLSGVCAAHYVKTRLPQKSFAVLEMRGRMGGTWDLFRYPGIRSDSDMPTLGFSFKPWMGEKSLADGGSILNYIEETAREDGTENNFRFHHKMISASWSSEDQRWTVDVETPDGPKQIVCQFLQISTGYYNYDAGYTPEWPQMDSYKGQMVYPQFWPKDLDWKDKTVTVIGSGATAVTLVPALAKEAKQVYMLQRSPTYIGSMPPVDNIGIWLQKRFGTKLGYSLTRWKNIGFLILRYQLGKRWPETFKGLLRKLAFEHLPEDYPYDEHFAPSYAPWDQRVCLLPDGDLFKAVTDGSAQMVTDEIAQFDETGLQLKSGRKLESDIVISATGLEVKVCGGATFTVDGEERKFNEAFAFKGAMYTGMPNFAVCMGYTNASWTLKCELISDYFTRLIQHMDKKGIGMAVPHEPTPDLGEALAMKELTSGYIQRAKHLMPKQTLSGPWRMYQNYIKDIISMRWLSLTRDMHFVPAKKKD